MTRERFLCPTSYDPPRDASSAGAAGVSPLGARLRARDPDRFFTALFAPPPRREALFALYAFDGELARASLVTQEPTVALIRLAWWREVVEGAARGHEVATPLAAALAAGALDRDDLLAVIAAREIEAEGGIATLADWRAWLEGSAGGVAAAAGRLLGAPEPEALRPLGAAWGAARLLRPAPALARRGGALLPADVCAAHGLTPEALAAHPPGPAVAAVRRALAAEARGWLAGAGRLRLPRGALAAALPAVLARRDLRRCEDARPGPPVAEGRGLGDRLAVLLALARGRV
jgi:15-cis-phytoene synthase